MTSQHDQHMGVKSLSLSLWQSMSLFKKHWMENLFQKRENNNWTNSVSQAEAATPEKASKCFTFCAKNMLSPIAKVHAQEPFPFDLAFAMTVNKDQGRTIKRVVVDLTHHPHCCCCMKCAAIFVAMSCVAERDHVRLSEPDTICQQESLCSCLSSIRPQKHIAHFLHGCSDDGIRWNPKQALQFSSKLNMS